MKLPLDSAIPMEKLTRYLLVHHTDSVITNDVMKLELYKHAVIAADLPDLGLLKGDVVTLVDELHAVDGSLGYAVEVFNAIGETIDVHMIPASAVEPLREDEVFCIRRLDKAAA